MKKISLFLILILVGLSACKKKPEVKFEAFSPEAAAYSLDSGWEVDATVMVRGYEMKNENSQNSVKVAYSVDLVTPDNKTQKGLFADTLAESSTDPYNDLKLESQIELNSTYVPGKYKVVFNIRDLYSGKQTSTTKELEVTK
ncbi:MAG: hypothetical protein Q8933_00275 [Bacteroidota bacterium]|nr:hypothetical protein [Bacteroidota bacterium]MDP4192454.1 hypothetical protein [Bacteroidota bacterium]MDP4197509.1 hypothetical protein [Bacteroidota bacterium]